MHSTAMNYLKAGLCVLPANRKKKFPTVGKWTPYKTHLPNKHEVDAWFANTQNGLCIVCGAVSGNLEMIDFDNGGELFDAWAAKIPGDLLGRLVIESTQSGGRHVAYRCEDEVCGNVKLAQRAIDGGVITLIETRGQGGLFLCAPTEGYELLQGELAALPVLTMAERELLMQAAVDLDEIDDSLPESDHDAALPSNNTHSATLSADNSDMPGGDFNIRGNIRPVLEKHGWACIGKSGDNELWRRPGKDRGTHSATFNGECFFVHSTNASPFEAPQGHSKFRVYTLLEHGGDFSASTRDLSAQGYGESDSLDTDVDISAIVEMSAEMCSSPSHNSHNADCAANNADNEPNTPDIADPGPVPEHMFDVPGFVRQVMDFTLANAPYPNIGLAFCGAMALQSYFCGRKVQTSDDLRPNIYLLALASSGTGKDFPRKVNSRVMLETGNIAALGDKFASGQGIQDALLRSNAMLFQNDEMDGVLRQINFDRENKLESIPNILLTLYTSADAVYPVRVKAGQKETLSIDQPHLTLFGTATPQFFYESLSQRMLTNGLFARMMIIDVGTRGQGQTPGSARHVPDSILDTARWWSDFAPGRRGAGGNLYAMYPEPKSVPFTPDALKAIEAMQKKTDAKWHEADKQKNEADRTAWSRACENAKKLALIYACSENHENPVISLAAIEWASAFALHQTKRQLYLAGSYVAENPFHAECLKLLRRLRESKGQMARNKLMRAMRCKLADFDQIIGTLLMQGDIAAVDIPTKTKTAKGYRIT